MIKNIEQKSEIIKDGADAISGIISCINPIFSTVPLLTFAINRVIGLISEKDIIKRIRKLEIKLKEKLITPDQFKEKVGKLTEHSRYVVSNNLNNILLSCIPETVDLYIEVLIDLIMQQDNNNYEELCEIINKLNVNDIKLLKMIKQYQNNGIREYYNKSIESDKKMLEKNGEIKKQNIRIDAESKKTNGIKKLRLTEFHDRNIRCENKTIFWLDFCKTFDLETPEMGIALIYKAKEDDGSETMNWAYIVRSFVKLNNLGVIVSDYTTTVGTTSNLNIDRFHITLFGELILEYV